MNVLALIEDADHVCYRYRIRPFEPALASQGGKVDVRPIEQKWLPRVLQLRSARRYEVTVVQRRLLADWQLNILRRRARRLVFDFDDAVLFRDSHDRRGPNCPRRASRFKRMMQLADVVIAGNAFLAEKARDQGARPDRIHVIPTCIETNRYDSTPAPQRRASGLDLVWIGSSSTLKGLEARADLWTALGKRFPSLQMRMICDRFAQFPPLAVQSIPWSEATEIDQLRLGHAGVSWVPEDEWSRGKCGLKLLQYMAAGLPAIANPHGVHTEIIVPGQTGFLARETSEWVEAVQHLALYPSLRLEMGQAARQHIDQHYSVRAWSAAFVSAVTGSAVTPESIAASQAAGSDPASASARRVDQPQGQTSTHAATRSKRGTRTSQR